MKWYTINEDFLNYLRSYESRIPIMDYGDDKLKPFFGELFEINGFVYLSQVSHPQKRHNYLNQNKDFFKLYLDKKLIAVVNLNYMFPVPKEMLIEVTYKNISSFRSFKTKKHENEYIVLLKREMKEIVKRKIDEAAFKLYQLKYSFPNDKISKRCLEFKELEKKCFEYIEKKKAKEKKQD